MVIGAKRQDPGKRLSTGPIRCRVGRSERQVIDRRLPPSERLAFRCGGVVGLDAQGLAARQ